MNVRAIVTNTNTATNYATIQAAINDPATLNGHTITFNSAHSEGLINVTKSVTIDGLNNVINSTSPSYGIEVSTVNVTLQNLTIQNAGTIGIQVDCNSHGLVLTNVTANNNSATGIGLNGSDNVVITNLTSTSNDGNGISITDCDNTSINGITTFGNFFTSGFNAGIGLFTSGVFCPPAGINGFSLTGVVNISEQTKVYSQKGNAAHVITGLSGPTIQWAVGIGALDRSYWPNKASAYVVVDALFEPPFNYSNTLVYVAEVATEDYYVEDNPAGDPTPPMLIQTAINFQASGNDILIEPGNYSEQALVNKTVTIKAASVTKPTIDYLGVVSGKPTLFDVSADGVSIENIRFNVDLSKLRSAIIVSGAAIDNITVKDNTIDAYGTPAGSYGDRNAVSINYGGPANYRVATGGVNSVTYQGNTVNGTMPTSFFRSAVSADEVGGTFTGNTATTINHDVLVRFGSNGPITITNNNCNGGGIEVAEQNATAGLVTVSGNIFTGVGAPNTAMLRIKNNQANIPHLVSLNTFNNYEWGVSMENVKNITLDGNIFNTASGTAHAVVVNTKSISSNSNSIVQTAIDATIINNDFNGTGSALTFQNHDSDNASFGTFTIGSAGNENDFASSLSKFIEMDVQSGSSNGSTFPTYPSSGGWPTTMAPWHINLDASNNRYDVGSGLQLPTAMTQTGLFSLEDKVQHRIDVPGLGWVNEKNNNTYVTINSFLNPLTLTADIQRGVDAASSGFIVNVGPGTFNNDVQVNKTVTVSGTGLNTTTVSGPIGGSGGATFQVQAAGVILEGMTITRDGNNTTDWNNAGLNSAGIAVQGLTVSAEVRFCKLTGNRTGIDINNSNGNNIHNNIIDFNRTGLIFRNQTDNTSFLNNFVTNNWTVGILFLDASGGTNSPVQTALNSAFNNNDISANWYGQIVDRQSGGSLPAPGTTNLKNFTCNWYGTITPVKTTANSAEPGYSTQIPVAYGGTATPPGGQPDIAGSASANFVYTPYLLSGVDVGANPDDGFQPAPGCVAPCALVLSTSSTDATCPNQNNGTATVNVTAGGTGGPYTYLWVNGQTTQTATGLTAGSYSVTVTDVNGCTASTSATVNNSLAGPVHNTNTLLNYCTIQAAINDPLTLNGHTITVDPGTYAENVTVNKELTILGPQANNDADARFASFVTGIDGPKASPASEAIITAPVSNPLGGNPGANDLIRVLSNNVTINGFTIDGNNPSIAGASSIQTGTIDIDARRAITNIDNSNGFNPNSNLVISYNIMQNFSSRGVSLANNGPVSTGNSISENVIRNFGADPVNGGQGIILFTNAYSDITNNTIDVTDNNIGLHLQNFFSNGSMSWSQNNVSVGQDAFGIHANLFYAPSASLNITNNTVNAKAGVTGASDYTWGINVWSVQVGSTVSVLNNTVGSSGGTFARGINLWNLPTSNFVTVSGGSVSNSEVGINFDNVDLFFGAGGNSEVNTGSLNVTTGNGQTGIRARTDVVSAVAPAGNVILNINNVTVNATGTGVPVAVIAPGSSSPYTASIDLGNSTLTGGSSGVLISGSQASANLHNNSATFTGSAIGVDVDGGTVTLFRDKIFANGIGVRVRNGGNLTSATENFIVNNTTDGILIEASAGTVGPINNNDLSGNGNYSINHLSSSATNAQCNWYGSATFATAEATINDPSGNLNWVPYLNSGTDNGGDPSDGFQATPGSCVCPNISFGITATTSNGSTGTANTSGGNATMTLEFCLGSHFTFMSYSSAPPANVGFVEQIIGTPPPVVLYNNSLVPIPRTPTDIKPSQVAGYFTGPYGPYSLSAGTSGQLVQTYVPYYDANNNDAYDVGECIDDTLTIIYNVTAPVINSCAVTRNITGCGTAAVTNPAYSPSPAASTYTEFSTAPNNGVATSQCSDWASVTYQDAFVTNCSTVVTRTWTLEDAGGNTVSCTQTINVNRPNTPPVVSPSAGSATVECASAANAPTPPTVNDACGAPITPSGPATSGTYAGCEGTIIYTWTYTDCAGLSSDYVFTYTVDHSTAPVVSPATGSANVECASSATIPTPPSATDVCGNPVIVTGPATSGTYAGCEGTIIYTWTYTDCAGLSSDYVFTYTVDHSTAPVVSPPSGSATSECAPASPPTPPAVTDVCGNPVNVTGPVITGTYAGCEGTIIYTWTYTDCAGLSSSYVFTHTVDHTTAPVVTPSSGSATSECAPASPPTPPTVTDVCGAPITPTGPVTSGTYTGCEGTIIYTWTYTDCAGLSSSYVYTHTVDHTTTPVVTPSSGSATVQCASSVTTPVPPTVTDVCGAPITPSGPVTSGTYAGCEGTIVYTWTYTDCSGLSSNYVFTYTVDHTTAPVVPANGSGTVQSKIQAVPPPTPSVTDVCGAPISPVLVSVVESPNPLVCEGTRTYNYSYTDCSGLSSGWSFTYTVDIDDNNVCTIDACNTSTGIITYTQVDRNDNNACTFDGCDPVGGVFHIPYNTNDGNPCTVDACNSVTGAITHTPIDVNDGNGCTVDACNSVTGGVTHVPVNTNDGNACTIDACNPANGNVTNTPIDVNDGNACTVDACNTATGGVTHVVIPVDDGNACTVDACNPANGNITHINVDVNDGNACTVDACNTATGGVTHVVIPVDDGNACTVDACNPSNGNITHTNVDVNDGNACTVDACNTSTGGITHTVIPVDDGNACTVDACNPANGNVTHTAVDPNDGNACTTDACNSTTGAITNVPLNINDNNACTVDACDPSSGNISHTPINTDDGSLCTTDGCNTLTGEFHTPVNVNDNNICTFDGCDPITGIFHNPVNTDDNNPCTVDGCNTVTGITHTPVNTNDNNLCTTDGCDTQAGVFHIPVNTNDNNPCTIDGCDAFTGKFNTPINTNDGNACTADACNSVTGAITHIPSNTNDNNACTDDACDPATGNITHTPVNPDDGNPCTTDACNSTTGAVTHVPVNVDDNNACTQDACNPSTGAVTHTNLPTDDNNVCTTDGCNTVTGVFHNQINSNDGNACTTDGCDPVNGPYHIPVDVDDDDVCTTDDCNTSTGNITHTPLNFNDGNACTTDGCDKFTGPFHNPVNVDDGNACTTDGCDVITGIHNTPVNTDDGDPCTTDACDTTTGAISHTDNTPTVNATAGSIQCYGGTTCVTVSATGGTPPYFNTGNYCGYGAGTYTFDVMDSEGCFAESSQVTIMEPAKLTVTTSSTPSGCNTNDGTATANASGGTPSYSYLWSPGGQTTSTATGLTNGSYTCTVTDANGCTTSAGVTVGAGVGTPAAPGPISGPQGVCRKQITMYCINPVPGADSYTWTLPMGASAQGTATGPCITVKFSSKFKGGFICVRANSGCGSSSNTCQNIVLYGGKPATPASISGPATLCPNATANYTISSVANATSYIWESSGNITINSGQGTTTVNVAADPGFNGGYIKVKAVNCKGGSGWRVFNIALGSGCRVQMSEVQTTTIAASNLVSSLNAFPNPTTGKLSITFESGQDAIYKLKIVNILGLIIMDEDVTAVQGFNQKDINLEGVAKGLYFISIQAEKSNAETLRIIVE